MLRVTSVTGIADQINVDLTRGRDFQSVGQFVYCCDGLPEARVPTAQKLEQWLNRMDSPSDRFKKSIQEALQRFWVLASTPGLNAGFTKVKQRVAPVEFVFIGMSLYPLFMESFSHIMRNSRRTPVFNEELHRQRMR